MKSPSIQQSALLAVVFLAAFASGLEFKECRTLLGRRIGEKPLNISIEGCDKLPCNMVRGSKVSGGMDFVYGQDLSSLKPVVTVYWLGLHINWPIYQDDGCTSLTLNNCPIKANTRARYEYFLQLKDTTPLVNPLMRFEFRDENGRTTICCELPINIVKKL